MKLVLRAIVILLAAALGVALIWAMLTLGAPPVRLSTQVAERLGETGVSHPVTAVLLNFRGFDTLLEVAVLLLALLGVLSVADGEGRGPVSVPDLQRVAAPTGGAAVLPWLARVLAPLMVLTAGYLLWAGAHQPGGAFQAAAVLAATAVLLHLAHLLPAWAAPGLALRAGLVFGLLAFITVAAALMLQGELLHYPPAWAGALILLIETALTLSLALILAGLFLSLSRHRREPQR
jgi:multisubunit Na+/H+ antiporter MnhB subunit